MLKRSAPSLQNLQRVVDCLHKEALLRVNSLSLGGLDVEEGTVELRQVFVKKVRLLTVSGAMMARVRMIVCGYIETVCWHALQKVAWGSKKLPELRWSI